MPTAGFLHAESKSLMAQVVDFAPMLRKHNIDVDSMLEHIGVLHPSALDLSAKVNSHRRASRRIVAFHSVLSDDSFRIYLLHHPHSRNPCRLPFTSPSPYPFWDPRWYTLLHSRRADESTSWSPNLHESSLLTQRDRVCGPTHRQPPPHSGWA